MDQALRWADNSERRSLTRSENEMEMISMNLERLCMMAMFQHFRQDENNEVLRAIQEVLTYIDSWFSGVSTARKSESPFLLVRHPGNIGVPNWLYFHSAFICFDICRFTLATLDYLLTIESLRARLEPNFLQNKSIQIKENIGKICAAVKQHAVEYRQWLQGPDAVQKLTQAALDDPADMTDPVGKELRKLVGEPRMEEIHNRFRMSWIEALHGISDIKIF
jgi:hypothetical protein